MRLHFRRRTGRDLLLVGKDRSVLCLDDLLCRATSWKRHRSQLPACGRQWHVFRDACYFRYRLDRCVRACADTHQAEAGANNRTGAH